MFRLGLGLALVGLVAAAHAVQPEDDYFAPKLDLLTTRVAHAGTNYLPPFKIGASVVLTRAPNTQPIESEDGNPSPLSAVARLQQEIVQPTNINEQRTNSGDRIALAHVFRVEFKDARVNVAVRPQSASIEVKQFKITLKTHSTYVAWNKAF